MPVPVSSDVPTAEQGERPPSRGYRHRPAGYGVPYPPYGYPQGTSGQPHYGHPAHPYSHHRGLPPGYPHQQQPGAYSPPHHHGYPGGRPIFGFTRAYERGGTPSPGPFPVQHSRDVRSKTQPFHGGGRDVSGGRSPADGSQRLSPVSGIGTQQEATVKSNREQPLRALAAPNNEPTTKDASAYPAARSHCASPTKMADDLETERLRQAALTEISPTEVAPIKTAFHFFVLDMRESLRPSAEAEVRRSTAIREGETLDPYLVNSNLNCRLMKAWEDLGDADRQACMTREEADRRRFMEEEEIASRHCATLTARSKSPKTPERRNSSHIASSSDQQSRAASSSPMTNLEPSPISRLSVEAIASMDNDEKKTDDALSDVVGSPINGGVCGRPFKDSNYKNFQDCIEGVSVSLCDKSHEANKRPSLAKQGEGEEEESAI